MGQVQQNVFKPVAGQYDFANDTLNGAVGIRRLGAFLAPNSTTMWAWTKNKSVFTDGGGGAMISFGWEDSEHGVIDPTAFCPATAIAAFTIAPVWTGINFLTNPFFKASGLELVMVISVAPITGGNCTFNLLTDIQN